MGADATTALDTAATAADTSPDGGSDAAGGFALSEEDPFSVFGIRAGSVAKATNDTTPLWLVNGLTHALVVSADAGAGAVVIDTVPPGDSVLVRIETRADSLRLTARTSSGEPRAAAVVRTDGTPRRVAFPR